MQALAIRACTGSCAELDTLSAKPDIGATWEHLPNCCDWVLDRQPEGSGHLGGEHEGHWCCRSLLNGWLYGDGVLHIVRDPVQLDVLGDVIAALHHAVELRTVSSDLDSWVALRLAQQ